MFLLSNTIGVVGAAIISLIIGVLFGVTLEIAGFTDSKKLAAVFYFRDMTVLKVMFTAIIVAMALVFSASALGFLDYNLIWVNPTYLWPGIVGGLIMGVGFIIGGFCPGTSLVAAATAKVDALFFVLGAAVGIFLFGETVGYYNDFWNSSYMGRFTLMDWLGWSTGSVVFAVIMLALFFFWGSEMLESTIGNVNNKEAPRLRYSGALALVIVAIGLIAIGQPSAEARWERVEAEKQPLINERSVYIHPGELLSLQTNTKLNLLKIDVRPEGDYNLFHLLDAQNVPLADIDVLIPSLHMASGNSVFILMSNDEAAATAAWQRLQAESVPNAYILEGGINNWLSLFAEEDLGIEPLAASTADDRLRFDFTAAAGANYIASDPNPHHYELDFTPNVKLEQKKGPSGGGCG